MSIKVTRVPSASAFRKSSQLISENHEVIRPLNQHQYGPINWRTRIGTSGFCQSSPRWQPSGSLARSLDRNHNFRLGESMCRFNFWCTVNVLQVVQLEQVGDALDCWLQRRVHLCSCLWCFYPRVGSREPPSPAAVLSRSTGCNFSMIDHQVLSFAFSHLQLVAVRPSQNLLLWTSMTLYIVKID